MGNRETEWNGRDTDRFMDLVLAGATPQRVSEEMGWSMQELRKHWQCFFNKHYQPSMPRIWRGGKPITALERRLIDKFKRRGYDPEVIGRILQRKPYDVMPDEPGRRKLVRMQDVAPSSDLLIAHHYLYYQAKHPVISDEAYDLAKKEELEFGPAGDLIHFLATNPTGVVHYPPHIRSLAHYLQFKDMKAQNCVDYDKLPMYYAPDGHWKKENVRRRENEKQNNQP